jgi:hypothetical protein
MSIVVGVVQAIAEPPTGRRAASAPCGRRQGDVLATGRRTAGHRLTLLLPRLHLRAKRAAHSVHDAAELSQQPVSGILDNSPTGLSDFGIYK